MNRSRLAVLTAAALVAGACSDGAQPGVSPDFDGPIAAASARAPEQVMPGEVVVKVKDGVDVSEVGRAHGLALGQRGKGNAFAVLRGAVGNEHANANALKNDPRVEWAEPNILRQVEAIDPRLWAFFNPGGLNMKYTSGKSNGQNLPASYASLSDADIDNIEGIAAGGSPVVVGAVDTGVDLDHPEFTGRLIVGYDWYNNDATPQDDDGHGTHTAGTMAGATVGVAGIAGAAANVKINVQKVCGRRGCPIAAIANGIRAAADVPNMVAINVSIGGTSLSQAEKDALAYATSKNVLVIVSAGNSNVGTVECPACDPNAISVGATDWKDTRAAYSNWGAGLDLTAPGGYCYSNTTSDGCIYSSVIDGYGWMQGTSMAAPQVTGTAAIVASKTGLRGAALRARLESTADDKGAAGYDTTFGNGRLNAYRAVTNTSLGSGL
ncbi:MAG TPA: S8 family serine peptidase [Longimicrobium sp.]|nr:S8 family serine peptidase [Longimicrobium sp.]